MEAPDKIYLHGYNFSKKPVNTWSEHPAKGMRGHEVINEEYIRKDALLEWIKAQLKENAEWREVNPDDRFFGGKEVAFERLIDKINSL